eukprot:c25949_g1_i1 orf=1-363(-)
MLLICTFSGTTEYLATSLFQTSLCLLICTIFAALRIQTHESTFIIRLLRCYNPFNHESHEQKRPEKCRKCAPAHWNPNSLVCPQLYCVKTTFEVNPSSAEFVFALLLRQLVFFGPPCLHRR